MTGRRGILGGLAALGAGLGSGRAGPPASVEVSSQWVASGGGASAVGQGRFEMMGKPEDYDRYRKLIDAEWARRRRLTARLELTGGVPPGILACRSWKPWFQAAVVDRWREEHLPDPGVVEDALRRMVFGGDP